MLEKMIKGLLIQGIKPDTSPITPCKPCLLAKAKQKPIPTSQPGKQSTELGDIVYSDIWGPATTHTTGHAKYYVIFVNDVKHWILINLMC